VCSNPERRFDTAQAYVYDTSLTLGGTSTINYVIQPMGSLIAPPDMVGTNITFRPSLSGIFYSAFGGSAYYGLYQTLTGAGLADFLTYTPQVFGPGTNTLSLNPTWTIVLNPAQSVNVGLIVQAGLLSSFTSATTYFMSPEYVSDIPSQCQKWLEWAQGQTSLTNAPFTVRGMQGAYDLSVDAAFQSVIEYCAQTTSSNCLGISLSNYSQVFPRAPFLFFSQSYNTSDPYTVVVPFTNLFFKSITALLVVDSANASFNMNNITPRSISVGPKQSTQFTVTLQPTLSTYTTSPGNFSQVTLQGNWPWYPAFGGNGTIAQFGPTCDPALSPIINNPLTPSLFYSISPPNCEIGDTNLTDQIVPPPGSVFFPDAGGGFWGVSLTTSFSGNFYQTGNNPFGYDCQETINRYYNFNKSSCFLLEPEYLFPFYRFRNLCWVPSITIFPPLPPDSSDYLPCNSKKLLMGAFDINVTPSWPSCNPTNLNIQGNPITLFVGCSQGSGAICNYNWTNPPDPSYYLPLFDPFSGCILNTGSFLGGFYPPGPNGICDPFIQVNSSYTTVRFCSNSGGGSQILNFYIQDASLGVANTPQANRSTQSLDYPILGGFLATIGPDTTTNALSGKRAYAYGFSLDSYFSLFFN